MTVAADVYGAVFERGSAVLLARVVDADGSAVSTDSISSIAYTITQLEESNTLSSSAVVGHEQVPLQPSDVLYNVLQTGAVWTVDAQGYNFRHEIDVSVNDAFPMAGVDYQVRYVLQPISGQKTVFRFVLRAI